MFNLTIHDLCNNGFEGSHQERHIFQEVFFGKDAGSTSEKSLVPGIISSGRQNCRIADTSLCTNSENSAVTSQSSTKSLLVEDLDRNENNVGPNTSSCFPERFSLVERDDENKSIKRMKLSAAEPSTTELDRLKVFTLPVLPEDITQVPAANTDPADHAVKLYLVEQCCDGFASSCHLMKQHAELDRACSANDLDILNSRLPNPDGNAGKEIVVGKVVASPVSQESFATKLLLAGPHSAVMEEPRPLVEERPKELSSFGSDISTLVMDPKKDPRLFLQSHISRLLLTAGWRIERRKRPCRKYMESVYLSPEGRTYREFSKAWQVLGKMLYTDGNNLLLGDIDKEWADISQFCSDLTDVLSKLEIETNQMDLPESLAVRWSLLDPFVNIVFIDRKIGSLRKGDTVRAARSIVVNRNDKDGAGVIKSGYNVGNQSSQVNLLAWHDDSYVSFNSGLATCGVKYHASDEQSGNKGFIKTGADTNGDAKCCAAVLNDEGDKDIMCPLDLATCEANVMVLDTTPLPPCGSIRCVQTCSCKCNLAVTAGNFSMHGKPESVHPHEDSSLIDAGEGDNQMGCLLMQDEPNSTFLTPGVPQQSGCCEKDGGGGRCLLASRVYMKEGVLKKKMRRKSRKISEIRSVTAYKSNDIDVPINNFDAKEVKENVVPARKKKGHKKSLFLGSPLHRLEKKNSNLKVHCDMGGPKIGRKKQTRCKIEDDDLLVSAIIKSKDCSPCTTRSASKKKAARKLIGRRKIKNQKGSCRLLPRNQGRLGKHFIDGKWSAVGAKTVLSWLIDTGAIHLNELIQYRDPKLDGVIKDGLVSRDGVICKCCDIVLSISQFKSHAGFNLQRPCLNLFMESGKLYTLCQLQAWSTEYQTRKNGTQVVERTGQDDQNDDSCGLCGFGGNLMCCDNCPATYHPDCLSAEEIPEGSWYCSNCTCRVCGGLVKDKGESSSLDGYKCSQCEHKYHGACNEGQFMGERVVSDKWFCSGSCQEVYSGLHSRLGVSNQIADGFSWMLLRCDHEDQKVHSAQRLALKAECNSKLAVALTIMEECFQSMVDPTTGIDMLPQVLYNWGSEFARLNYHGFYTVVLERDDVLVSVASIRVHGAKVAEMPLIATCSDYRRQGMCRRLMTAIEEMLISLKVEKLVISAIPELVATWTEGFGFILMSSEEKQSLRDINYMVFPGAVWLKKPLYESKETEIQPELPTGEHVTKSKVKLQVDEVDTRMEVESEGSGEGERENIDNVEISSDNKKSVVECVVEPSDGKFCCDQGGDCVDGQVGESDDSKVQEQFSKMSCGETTSVSVGGSNDECVNDRPCLDRQSQVICELNIEN